MKKTTQFFHLHKIFLGFALVLSFASFAQVQKAFAPRFNQTVKGDVTIIANNIISRTSTGNYTGASGNHNFNNNVYVDIDADNSTFNSSSANFTNPEPQLACLSIRKAYLYWAAADLEPGYLNSDNNANWNYNNVKLMLPGQTSYNTITADEVIFRGRNTHFSNDPYICVKDITSDLLNISNPYGKYQVANIEAKTGSLIGHGGGNTGTSGGWQIVFVYESPNLPSKNVSLFDGYAHISNGISGIDKDFDINFNGFQTISSGPVNAKFVIGALEGDRDLSGDRLQIRNRFGNFVDLSAPNRSSSNFFNSRITVGNSNFTDRNPASTNTLGFDAAVFELNNGGAFNSIIGNSQTSAQIRLTSNQETYGLYLLGLSIDVWAPDMNPIEMVLNTGGNSINPDSTIGVNFNLQNLGNDNAVNFEISTLLPPQLEFLPGNLPNGITYTLDNDSNELTFFIADGLLSVGSPLIDVDFEFKVKDECYFLEDGCALSYPFQFNATYNGVLNPSDFSTLSSATINDCNVGILDPTVITFNQPSEAIWATPINELDRALNCDDTDALALAQSLSPETDKCDFTYTKVTGDFVPDENCQSTGTYTNTWVFTDACGRTSSEYVQVITIGNPNGPDFNEVLPESITVQCDNIPEATILTASALCGETSLTYNETRANGNCSNQFTLTRVWTATDDCNNTNKHIQVITVEDTTPPTLTIPSDVKVECGTSLEPADIGNATATDACGEVTLTFNDVSTATCGSTEIVTRTWTATDACGNVASADQIISTEDTTPPTLTIPGDVKVECGTSLEPADIGNATATDACGEVTITFNDVSTATCGSTEIVTRTWTATDACGNVASAIQIISTEDTTPPTLAIPSDVKVECGTSLDPADIGNATATDACGEVTITFNDVSTATCGSTEIVTRTWTATDACGNVASADQIISTEDTTPPTLTIPSDVKVECGTSLDPADIGNATATDACGEVTITFNDVSNAACGTTEIVTRTWTATDTCGNVASADQIISTEDITPPTLTIPSDVKVECGTSLDPADIGNATATDACGEVTITFNDVSTVACGTTEIVTRTWTATDACGNVASADQIITTEDTTAPTFTVPADITIACDVDATDLTLTGDVTDESDNCSSNLNAIFTDSVADGTCPNNSVITRTWSLTDQCDNSTTFVQTITVQDISAPIIDDSGVSNIDIQCGITLDGTLENWLANNAGATASDNCGTITWTNDFGANTNLNCSDGAIVVTFTATDSCGNADTFTATYSIIDTNAPVLTVPNDITVECDETTDTTNTGMATAVDDCAAVSVSFTDSEVEACGNTKTITRNWSATDACGNSVSEDQIITVKDTKNPTFTVPADITIECDVDVTNLALTGDVTDEADNCATDLDATFTDSIADGICSGSSIITRTWSLTDDCDNTTTNVQTIIIQDTTPPTFSVPADITIACDVDATDLSLTGDVTDEADSCSSNLEAVFTDSVADGTCPGASIITRTWSLTDDCDNTTTSIQTITIQDTAPPMIDETTVENINIECGIDPKETLELWLNNNAGATATDSCGDVTWTNDFGFNTDIDCDNSAIIVRFTATDECGNSATVAASYSISDTLPPTLTVPTDVTIECNESTDPTFTGTAIAVDDCAAPNISFTDSEVEACGNTKTITRTWTAIDVCGNSVSEDQIITVQDTTPPTFSVPADITLECDVDATDLTITGDVTDEADNCSANLDAVFTDSLAEGTCPGASIITRTWSLTDDCDNTTTFVQTITVQDTTPPTFSVPADITLECDADATDLTITGDVNDEADNCSANLEAVFSDSLAEGTCPGASIITRTWSLTDDCDNTTTFVQTITVQDTTPPTFSVPADITLECDVDVTDLTITGNVTDEADNCSSNLEAVFTDSVTDGTCPGSSIITRTWTLTDDCDNTTTLMQTITVQDTTPPTFSVPADITLECDVDVTDLTITGDVTDEADNCSANLDAVFTDSVTDGTCPGSSIITRTWTLTDDCDNTTTLMQTITVQDTTPPTFSVPADITLECDVDVTDLTITGDVTDEADNCSANLDAVFTDSVTDGTCPGASIITRTWTLTDDCDNTTTLMQTITVQDTTAPLIDNTTLENINIECASSADGTLESWLANNAGATATDNCGLVTWTNNYDSNTNLNCEDGGISVIFTATDDCGNSSTVSATYSVIDTVAPILTVPSDITIECNQSIDPSITGMASAEDECAETDITYEDSEEITCGNAKSITRTWTATDTCGNTVSVNQIINVQDTTAPTFTVPQDLTIECNGDTQDLNITGDVTDESDNCSTDLNATFTDNIIDGNCPGEFMITRTWSLTDDCNNTTTLVQTITVQDTAAPVFNEMLPSDIDAECDAIPAADTLTATDSCGTVEVTFEEETINGLCLGDYIIQRTWKTEDSCGNLAEHTQLITVQDTTAPALVSPLEENIVVACDGIPEKPSLVFEDSCSNDITVTYNETSTQTNISEDYNITRVWTVTDDCGNTADYTQNISVELNNVINVEDGFRCVLDIEFDLFELLSGNYNRDGSWSVIGGDTTLNGSSFDPSTAEVGEYTFLYAITDGPCPTEVEVNVTIDDDCLVLPCSSVDNILISKTVTANGDNVNDYFTVQSIEECGFVIELQIFNRWGAEIYKSNNYQNDWNGEAHSSSIGSSGKVPTGTYYYIINVKNSGLAPFTGPIYVATN
ncbi:T9SS type B sorting domain-containing protein [Winogradskyella bathintestinalis]|uniref:Gliding motility-associated C-terminal domain-containing protein n=1 Tax=Winogradskyella bathintestinalis TaxID=3035208 RepID=A0ABT7ZSU2_9FLAO|nr:gliding motility-associated C-terminal domain-containing protein [Winogradskyella bathintestinalis]MDN3492085.1 gliding motility-associated C-terminal domain-containing protein [Winogradskyella bathintestinalis]